MSDYQVSGLITNSDGKPASDLLIQVMESDQGTFQDRNDDLLGGTWIKNDGTFKIGFDEKQYTELLNFLREGNPDIYLIIRNNLGEIIHTTDVRKEVKPSQKKRLRFNIKLDSDVFEKKIKPKDNPYADTMNRRLLAFQSFGQRADFTDDLQRTFALLVSSLNAWAGYNNELSWKAVGYDGPLVKRFPWKKPHSHKVKWKK